MRRLALAISIFGAAALSAGCVTPPQPVAMNLGGVTPSAQVDDLAAVLDKCVTDDGRLDGPALAGVHARLAMQVAKFAVTGPTATPELFPTDASRWAYWHNARIAWSIMLADLARLPERVGPEAMADRPFPLDGRTMTLRDIDAILLAEARRTGKFTLAACAAGVSVNDAPLPRQPYSQADIVARLDAELDRLVRSPARFVVDINAKQVQVPPMLWECRELVLAQYGRATGATGATLLTALRPLVGFEARLALDGGMGYEIVGQAYRPELALTKPGVYFPGKVGKVE
jgi:hypothetical protein